MNLLKALLFVAMMLQPWYKDQKTETHEQRVDRYTVISSSIVKAADSATCTGSYQNNPYCSPIWKGKREELGFLLLTQAYMESRFARNVHAGNCEKHQCDAYKDKTGKILHRSASIWQVQSTGKGGLIPRSEWVALQGLDQQSTDGAAWAATKVLSSAYRQCRTIPGAISLYAGIPRCDWPRASYRNSFYERLLRKGKRAHANGYQRNPTAKDKKKDAKDPVKIATITIGSETCDVTKYGLICN